MIPPKLCDSLAERHGELALPGQDGPTSTPSNVYALAEVLREHRSRLDLVVLYPDSAACEILASSNPDDRADFLENRPGAIDLTAMPLRDAIDRLLHHRDVFGQGVDGIAPATATGEAPQDVYLVLACRQDDKDGDDDLTAGVNPVAVDCRVPLEDRFSAVLDIWHTSVAIKHLDDWEFAVLAPDGGLTPQGSDYEPPQGLYEAAGAVIELGGDPYELGQAQRVEVTTSAVESTLQSARNAGFALVRTTGTSIVEVPADQASALLRQHPGSVRLDDAHPYAADEAIRDAEGRARAIFTLQPGSPSAGG